MQKTLIAFRIETKLLNKLKDLADNNDLTTNKYIIELIEKAVKKNHIEKAVKKNHIEKCIIADKKYSYIEKYIDFNPLENNGEWLTTTQIKEKTKIDIPINILGKIIKNTGVKSKIINGINKYYISCRKN